MVDTNASHKWLLDGGHRTLTNEKEVELEKTVTERDQKQAALDQLFEDGKEKARADFSINKGLGSYKNLNTGLFFDHEPFALNDDKKSLKDLLEQYNTFKSLPSDPQLPLPIDIDGLSLNTPEMILALEKITSPSSVAEDFKQKIESTRGFFETGLGLYEADPSECPFCTQNMSHVAIMAVTAYQDYFNDAEAKERGNLGALAQSVKAAIIKVERWKTKCLEEKGHFDDLKKYFPSFIQKTVTDLNPAFADTTAYLQGLLQSLKQKSSNLTVSVTMLRGDLLALEKEVEEKNTANKKLFSDLTKVANSSKSERLSIQNDACDTFLAEFFKNNKPSIKEIRDLTNTITGLRGDIADLKRTHGDEADARERIVETFSLLLRQFFGEKYSFDGKTSTVRHNNKEMDRGADRTLSDGEKSAMAFCYFIAQTHLRVESNDDYKNVFFIIDDPVSSMSFDYVYAIAWCLKQLRISANGEIKMANVGNVFRPKMLILTHNTYFYNVVASNKIVQPQGLFQLVSGINSHELTSQKKIAAPHSLQLEDVHKVAERRKDPDHTTANSIRSVIESMYKFCRPDLADTAAFIEFLTNTHNFEIKYFLLGSGLIILAP